MRWMPCALFILALAPRTTEAAEKVRVAVAKVRARSAAKPDKLETGIRTGIASHGSIVIPSAQLSKAARDVGVKADSAEGARAAGADYLVKVKLSLKKKKFVAEAELIRASDGEVIEKLERGYAAKAALATGKNIGKVLGKRAKDLGRPSGAVAEATPPPPPPKAIIAPPPEETADEAPPPSRTIEPKEDDEESETIAKAEIEKRPSERSGREDGWLRAQLAGGAQLGSAYTVVVGGKSTGLAYSLTPILQANASAIVRIAPIGLFFGGRFDFAPVEYQVNVDPPVDPPNPKGSFLSAGGTIGYEVLNLALTETFRLKLSPVVGVGWDSLSVESQGDNTIVVSWSAVNAGGGVSVAMILFDSLVFEVEGRGGYVFSYSEKPKNSGEGGAGFDVLAGLSIRYWLIDLFGLYIDAGYEYMRVSLKGEGTRVRFMEDEPIVDAAIHSADFEVGVGVMLGI